MLIPMATLSTAAVPRNLVTSSELQNGSGVVISRSEYSYTETNTTQHAWNLTEEYHWDSTKVASISTGTILTAGRTVIPLKRAIHTRLAETWRAKRMPGA